jgi:hypothetical protein
MAVIGGVNQTIFFEQPMVARYVALAGTAGGFAVPDASGSSDRHFFGIELPGVTESPSAIFYRTRHTGRPSFSVRINDATLTKFTFTDADPPERSWHEIIPPGPTLKAQNNELVFGVSNGTVIFGDVVILYTSSELTIRIPVVITAKG